MSKRVLKNILKNGDEYEVGNIKLYVITEDIVTVVKDSTKGVSPYNTSYGYTNITIDEGAGIKWKEGAVYTFVVNTEMVVASAYRNVRVRIGTGAYIPVMGTTAVLAGSSYFTKANIRQYQYSTKYQSGGALHLFTDSNTTYSSMTSSEAETGTATSARSISASVLKSAIEHHAGNLHDNTKQDKLETQTAYENKGSATKVPKITTNTLGQVTDITEVDIGVSGGEWGGIDGDINDQADLMEILGNKQNKLTSANAGTNISIVQSILPDGYTQLSYLGANGTFDTGIKTTNNSRIEALWTKNKDDSKFIYVADSGSTLTTNTTAYSTSGNANWRFGNRAISINTSALIEYLTVQDSSGVTVNGTKYDYTTVNTFTSSNNLIIFSAADEDIIRIQYLKHYNGEDLTLYLVPAKRNSDNAYGFYDLVNDTFLTDSTYTYDVGAEINTTISFVNDSGLALDSEVVHTTGDETIGGAKKFTSGIEVNVNSDSGLNIKSTSAGGYLYVTRGSGSSAVQSEIKSVSSGGAFGTATNHPLMLRTNDTTQVTVGTDGSVVLETDVASNSNNNQVATTKWTNSKLGDYLAKANTTAFTPSGDYNPATKKYVDDNDTVKSGDSGTTYTIKVSNSAPASGTPATTITFVTA